MLGMKNLCAKTRPDNKPYEIWEDKTIGWKWLVLKKWQADDDKPYGRWFCKVITPIVPEGELGDVYVSEIKTGDCIFRDWQLINKNIGVIFQLQ